MKQNNINHYSTYTNKGAPIAEAFNKTLRNLLKKPVFLKGKGRWIDELQSTVKKYNNSVHNSIKMSPIEASKKKNENEVSYNLSDKRIKKEPKYNLGDLVQNS